jgi:hypothetical protein
VRQVSPGGKYSRRLSSMSRIETLTPVDDFVLCLPSGPRLTGPAPPAAAPAEAGRRRG